MFPFRGGFSGGVSVSINKNKLHIFVSFLEDDTKGDVQAATAGILANLPASDSKLTAALVESEALPALIKVIKNGTSDSLTLLA